MADHSDRRIRAVILDLDGTLLTSAGDVTAATREALARLAASGIHVVAATARAPRGVYGVVPEIPWAVCCNGAIIYDVAERTIRWERTFEPTAAVEIIQAVRDAVSDVGFAARTGDVIVCNRRYAEERSGSLPAGSRIIEHPAELGGLAVHGLAFRRAGLDAIDLADAAHETFPGRGEPTRSTSHILDVTPPGVSKSTALGVLAERQRWTPQEAVAFGDMPNDLDVFDWAGLTIAAANAHPDIRAVADMVTASNDDDGVLHALRGLQLLETPRGG